MVAGEGKKKARYFGPPTLRGPTLRGPTFWVWGPHPPPSGLEVVVLLRFFFSHLVVHIFFTKKAIRLKHQFWPESARPKSATQILAKVGQLRLAKVGQIFLAKVGLAKVGQIRMAEVGISPAEGWSGGRGFQHNNTQQHTTHNTQHTTHNNTQQHNINNTQEHNTTHKWIGQQWISGPQLPSPLPSLSAPPTHECNYIFLKDNLQLQLQ